MSKLKEIIKQLLIQLLFIGFVLIVSWCLELHFHLVLICLIIKYAFDQIKYSINQKVNFENHRLNQEEDLSQIRQRITSLEYDNRMKSERK